MVKEKNKTNKKIKYRQPSKKRKQKEGETCKKKSEAALFTY